MHLETESDRTKSIAGTMDGSGNVSPILGPKSP